MSLHLEGMIKVGLTGGIGSGKSTVAEVFKTLGIPVFDADSAAKNIMETNTALIASIIEKFGEQSYIDGKLNRKHIAGIVFNDAYQLEVLNSITHPITIQAFQGWVKLQNAPYIIKEAALLFEAGTAGGLDVVIGVYAPQALRIKRVMQRDNVERQAVLDRMSKQIKEEIKMRLCDYVVVNDEQQLLLPQVLQLHKKLMNKALQ